VDCELDSSVGDPPVEAQEGSRTATPKSKAAQKAKRPATDTNVTTTTFDATRAIRYVSL
jgi:hypothetical protein